MVRLQVAHFFLYQATNFRVLFVFPSMGGSDKRQAASWGFGAVVCAGGSQPLRGILAWNFPLKSKGESSELPGIQCHVQGDRLPAALSHFNTGHAEGGHGDKHQVNLGVFPVASVCVCTRVCPQMQLTTWFPPGVSHFGIWKGWDHLHEVGGATLSPLWGQQSLL